MDIITYVLCKKLIENAMASVGSAFEFKGVVANVSDLPQSGNTNGDIYLVGPNSEGSYEQYVWLENENSWKSIGSTSSGNAGNYITEEELYKGSDGTGTIDAPAADTIMAILNSNNLELLKDKVDKVDGKGLSSNDYTNEDKQKLNNIADQAIISLDFKRLDTLNQENSSSDEIVVFANDKEIDRFVSFHETLDAKNSFVVKELVSFFQDTLVPTTYNGAEWNEESHPINEMTKEKGPYLVLITKDIDDNSYYHIKVLKDLFDANYANAEQLSDLQTQVDDIIRDSQLEII